MNEIKAKPFPEPGGELFQRFCNVEPWSEWARQIEKSRKSVKKTAAAGLP